MMISRKQFPLSPTAYVETIFDSSKLEYDVSISKKMERKYSNSVRMGSEDWTKMTNNLNFFANSAIERQTVISRWLKKHKNTYPANYPFPQFEPHELQSTFSSQFTMVLAYHGYQRPNNLELVTYICPYVFAPAEAEENRSSSTHKLGAVVLCPQRGVKLNFDELMTLHNLVDEIGCHIAKQMTTPHNYTLDGSASLLSFQAFVTSFFNNPRCNSVKISLNKPQPPEYLERYRKEEGLSDGMCCCACKKCAAKYPCYSICSFQLKRRHGFGHETAEFNSEDSTKKSPGSKIRKKSDKGPLQSKAVTTVKAPEDNSRNASSSDTAADVNPTAGMDSDNSATVATTIDDSAMGLQPEKEVEEEDEEEDGGKRIWKDLPIFGTGDWKKIQEEIQKKKEKTGATLKTLDSSKPLVFGVNWCLTEQPLIHDILMDGSDDNAIDLSTQDDDEQWVNAVMKPTDVTQNPDIDPVLAT